MKNLFVLFIFSILSISASSGFAMARKLPKQPAQPAKKLYPSGKTFVENGSSYDSVWAESIAQSYADQDCTSGKAIRIGAWQVSDEGSYQFPGTCQTVNGDESCTDSTELDFVSAGSRFQCK